MNRIGLLLWALLLGAGLAAADTLNTDSVHAKLQAAYDAGRWDECAREGLAAVGRGVAGPAVFYDVSRCYARGQVTDSVYCYLDLAVEHGFISVRTLVNDPAFLYLHGTDPWQAAVYRMRERQEEFLKRNNVNIELFYLKEAELQSRQSPMADADTLRMRRPWRQARVREIIEAGTLRVAEDFGNAAVVLELSEDPVTRELVRDLVRRALEIDPSFKPALVLDRPAETREEP